MACKDSLKNPTEFSPINNSSLDNLQALDEFSLSNLQALDEHLSTNDSPKNQTKIHHMKHCRNQLSQRKMKERRKKNTKKKRKKHHA